MTTVGELEKKIFEKEGFNVRFCNNGRKVRSDCITASVYPYKNAGYATWTVKQWKETRMAPYLQDYEIEVLEFDGTPAAGNRTLKRLREQYPVVKQSSDSAFQAATPAQPVESTENQAKRIEKEMYPVLKRDNPASIPSIEVAIDYVPEEYQGESLDLVLKLVQAWVDENGYHGKGIIWQWFCIQSVDFVQHYSLPVPSEFICMLGFPQECREAVATKLQKLLGKAVKYPADPLGYGELQVARSMAYAEDGIVWEPDDACTWLSVKLL